MEMVWNLRESKISSLARMMGADEEEVTVEEVEVEDVWAESGTALDEVDAFSDSAFVCGSDVLLAFEPTTPPTTAPVTTSSKMRAPNMIAVFLLIPHNLAFFSSFTGGCAPASE